MIKNLKLFFVFSLVLVASSINAASLMDGFIDPQSKDVEGKLITPSISAVFGMYTENDTWFAGGAHLGFDIAKDPEDTAFYLQFGHAWR